MERNKNNIFNRGNRNLASKDSFTRRHHSQMRWAQEMYELGLGYQ